MISVALAMYCLVGGYKSKLGAAASHMRSPRDDELMAAAAAVEAAVEADQKYAASHSTHGIDVLLECLDNSQPDACEVAINISRTFAVSATTNRLLPFAKTGPGSSAAASAEKRSVGTVAPAPRKLPRCFGVPKAELPFLSLPTGVSIVYTRSCGEANAICDELRRRLPRPSALVGLDIEWTVSYVSNRTQQTTSLVQVATAHACYLFQVSAMTRFPERLTALLEDGDLIKSGNKVVNDALKLRRDFGCRVAGLLDLGRLAGAALRYGERPWSLSDLCEAALHKALRKELRLSNWDAHLTDEQLGYAAMDAWASRQVGLVLLRRIRTAPSRGREQGALWQAPSMDGDEQENEEVVLLRAVTKLVEHTPADPNAANAHGRAAVVRGGELLAVAPDS